MGPGGSLEVRGQPRSPAAPSCSHGDEPLRGLANKKAVIADLPVRPDRVDRADDGAGEARQDSVLDSYAAFLEDPADNHFGAVYRDGAQPKGNIDQLAIRVPTSRRQPRPTTIGPAAGLTLGPEPSTAPPSMPGRKAAPCS